MKSKHVEIDVSNTKAQSIVIYLRSDQELVIADPSTKHKQRNTEEHPKTYNKTQKEIICKKLREGPQTRKTLAEALEQAGLVKDKSDEAIFNYISVMLAELRRKKLLEKVALGMSIMKSSNSPVLHLTPVESTNTVA